jgi:hypothetical protein
VLVPPQLRVPVGDGLDQVGTVGQGYDTYFHLLLLLALEPDCLDAVGEGEPEREGASRGVLYVRGNPRQARLPAFTRRFPTFGVTAPAYLASVLRVVWGRPVGGQPPYQCWSCEEEIRRSMKGEKCPR